MIRRPLVVLATLLAVQASMLAPAHAATGSTADAAGDAPASLDLTRLTVKNGTDAVQFWVKVRDLGAIGIIRVDNTDNNYNGPSVLVKRTKDGTVTAKRAYLTEFGWDYSYCAGIRKKWDRELSRVWVLLPRACASSGNKFEARSMGLGGAEKDYGLWLTVARG